jgi:segregation and condensation protein B
LDDAKEQGQFLQIEDSQVRLSGFMDEDVSAAVEALIFASPMPLTSGQLARLVPCDKRRIPQIVENLNMKYVESARTFRIERFDDSYRYYTIPEYDKYISRLADLPRPARLSRAALEVLSIIAYRQPVVKSEIERIRGIDSDGVIRTLIERGLIAVAGRSDSLGRPLLYKTTSDFLEFFGIADLYDLPSPDISESDLEASRTLTLLRQPEKSAGSGGPEAHSLDASE